MRLGLYSLILGLALSHGILLNSNSFALEAQPEPTPSASVSIPEPTPLPSESVISPVPTPTPSIGVSEKKIKVWPKVPALPMSLGIVAINHSGSAVELNYPISTKWIWKYDYVDRFDRLYVRVKIEFPDQYRIEVIPDLTLVKYQIDDNELTFDLPTLPNTIGIKLFNKDPNRSKLPHTLELSVYPKKNSTYFAAHSSCLDLDVGLKALHETKDFIWTWAYCREKDQNNVEVLFYNSHFHPNPNSKNKEVIIPQTELTTLTFPLHSTDQTQPEKFDFSLIGEKKEKPEYELIHAERETFIYLLGYHLGSGFTLINYQEPAHSIKMSEVGLNLRTGVRYPLVEDLIDLDSNLFTILAPKTLSGGVSPSQFIGVNGRIGYRLPMDLWNFDWSAFVGFYILKMMVPGNAYGIKQVTGGQYYLTFRSDPSTKHPVYFYLKYAPLLGGGNGVNREYAFGGEYLIRKYDQRPLSLTADFSKMDYVSSDNLNEFSMLAVSLGISYSF